MTFLSWNPENGFVVYFFTHSATSRINFSNLEMNLPNPGPIAKMCCQKTKTIAKIVQFDKINIEQSFFQMNNWMNSGHTCFFTFDPSVNKKKRVKICLFYFRMELKTTEPRRIFIHRFICKKDTISEWRTNKIRRLIWINFE